METYKKYFYAITCALEVHHIISIIFRNKSEISFFHKLHLKGIDEFKKHSPDINKIELLLSMINEEIKDKQKINP